MGSNTQFDGSRLIEAIAQDLRIFRGKEEEYGEWINRVTYSAVGRQILAAVWDEETGEKISTQSIAHIKKRGMEILETIKVLFPNIQFNIDVDEILSLYRNTGHLIHYNNNYEVPNFACAEVCGKYLLRGTPVAWKNYAMSGLGGYSTSCPAKTPLDWRAMYQIPDISINKWWEQLQKELEFVPIVNIPEKIEYCHIGDYMKWNQTWPKANKMVFYRTSELIPSNRKYGFLRRGQDGQVQKSAMPKWLVPYDDDRNRYTVNEYHRIGYGLLMESGQAPVARIKQGTESVTIQLTHPLPYFENNFFKLFTWPEFQGKYKRVCQSDLFPVIEDLLVPLGYKMKEE